MTCNMVQNQFNTLYSRDWRLFHESLSAFQIDTHTRNSTELRNTATLHTVVIVAQNPSTIYI